VFSNEPKMNIVRCS